MHPLFSSKCHVYLLPILNFVSVFCIILYYISLHVGMMIICDMFSVLEGVMMMTFDIDDLCMLTLFLSSGSAALMPQFKIGISSAEKEIVCGDYTGLLPVCFCRVYYVKVFTSKMVFVDNCVLMMVVGSLMERVAFEMNLTYVIL